MCLWYFPRDNIFFNDEKLWFPPQKVEPYILYAFKIFFFSNVTIKFHFFLSCQWNLSQLLYFPFTSAHFWITGLSALTWSHVTWPLSTQLCSSLYYVCYLQTYLIYCIFRMIANVRHFSIRARWWGDCPSASHVPEHALGHHHSAQHFLDDQI